MSVLSWGKCTITHTSSVNGAPNGGAWNIIATPKEDTTKLTPTAGTEKIATQEGGEVVDVMYGANTYEFEFTLFVKKNEPRPFTDNDGVIAGEHALRVVPQDPGCEGIQIDRCVIRCEESFSTADGKTLRYVAKPLKPASGKTVKDYVETPAVATPAVSQSNNSITITCATTGASIEYKIGNGSWTAYSSAVTATSADNGKILYARASKDGNTSAEATHTVTYSA